MAITVTSITPDRVGSDGGQLLTLVGTFVDGERYRIFIGKDATGYPCYSGVPGQGNDLYSGAGVRLRCFVPAIPPRGPYQLYLRSLDSLDEILVSVGLHVFPQDFKTKIFDFRRVLPPYWRTGPRNMETLEPVP